MYIPTGTSNCWRHYINKNAVELVKKQDFVLFLQPVISGPKTKQQVETYTRSQQPQQIPQGRKIQNGDTKNNKDLSPNREVGNVNRLQGCLLPHTNPKPVQKEPKLSCTGTNIKVQSTSIWSVHSTPGVHCRDQRGQI